jgi:hypothetical protein
MVEEKGRMEAERQARAAEATRAKAEAEKAEEEKKQLREELETLKRIKEEVEMELAKARAEMPNEGELEQLRRLRGQTFTLREAIREIVEGGEGGSRQKLREHEKRLEVLEDIILRLTGKRPSEIQEDHSYGPCDRLLVIATGGGGGLAGTAAFIPPPVQPQQQQLPAPSPHLEPMAVNPAKDDSDEDGPAPFVPGEVSVPPVALF